MNKYIYQTCEHHENCDWKKPEEEAEDSNMSYINHLLEGQANEGMS